MSDEEHNRIAVGDIVIDQDAANPGKAKVVAIPGTKATDEDIDYLNKTVAEANPGYPADDPIIHVKFLSPLDGKPQGTTYSYPYSRLQRVSEDEKGLRMDASTNDDEGESA